MLSTLDGPSGRQVTYDGWPLYRFVGDSAPGEALGQGIANFGGVWMTMAASGTPVNRPSSTTSTSPAPMNGNY
jgi:predicted lipoprotein with Yx(FWY)xxD motif